jgi:hypothetical protein
MRFRITQKAGWLQGWMSVIALMMCLAAFCAHAPVRHRRPLEPASQTQSDSRPGRFRQPQAPAQGRSIAQAQAADDETGGGDHSRADLALATPVPVLAPGRPERAAGYRSAGPAFPSGCAVNGSRPRPPPSLA